MTDKRIMDKDKYELTIEETSFVEDVRNIISTAKEHAYKTANLMIVVSNWLVGRRIVLQEQKGKYRAEYGKRIISIASQELTKSFGKGYGETTLKNYRKFYKQFSNFQIRQPLLAEFENAHHQFGNHCLPNLMQKCLNFAHNCHGCTMNV